MNQKIITLNIGMNDLPLDLTFSQILDGLAYSFDVADFDWGAVGSYWEGEPERTIVVRFKIDRLPDSTILKKLEAACSVLNQDAIGFVISSMASTPYLKGLAYAPSVGPNYRILFDAQYFKGIGSLVSAEDSTGVLKYTSKNLPMGSRHRMQAVTCGGCGINMSVQKSQQEATCIACGFSSDVSDFPDAQL